MIRLRMPWQSSGLTLAGLCDSVYQGLSVAIGFIRFHGLHWFTLVYRTLVTETAKSSEQFHFSTSHEMRSE